MTGKAAPRRAKKRFPESAMTSVLFALCAAFV